MIIIKSKLDFHESNYIVAAASPNENTPLSILFANSNQKACLLSGAGVKISRMRLIENHFYRRKFPPLV